MRKRDSGEILGSGLAKNVENWGKRQDMSSSRNRSRSKSRSGQQIISCNCGKPGHTKRDCRNQKQTKDNTVNAMAEEIHDALFLVVHIAIGDWV